MPNEKSSYIEAAGKASCMLYAQDGRHVALCIHILGSQIYLTIFDHGGSLSTTGFNIHLCPHSFLHILIGVSCATLDTLRFNTSIRWREDEHNGNVVQLKELEFVKDNTTYTIELTKVLFISDNLHGWGTMVWKGIKTMKKQWGKGKVRKCQRLWYWRIHGSILSGSTQKGEYCLFWTSTTLKAFWH